MVAFVFIEVAIAIGAYTQQDEVGNETVSIATPNNDAWSCKKYIISEEKTTKYMIIFPSLKMADIIDVLVWSVPEWYQYKK